MSSFEEYYYRNIGYIERCERKISNKVLIKILEMWEIQPSEFFSFSDNYKWQP